MLGMEMTPQKSRSGIGRGLVIAVLFACSCNLLSSAHLNYQNHAVDLFVQHRSVVMGYPYNAVAVYPPTIVQCLYLAPFLVAIIFRRSAIMTFVCASLLFTILAGRIYYLVQFYRVGLSGVPKFDWAEKRIPPRSPPQCSQATAGVEI
jgi:hypothetical protein